MTTTKQTIAKFKLNQYVRITTGKFRGWRGLIGFNVEYDEHDKQFYYILFPREKITRRGVLNPKLIGLGLIINIQENHLKEVIL